MMGFAFGGLAVLSVPRHVGAWSSLIEIRSMFLAFVFSLVVIVLAYIMNPSETSFRAFLTEQSFRHHLTKLDDAQDDHQIDHRKHGLLDATLAKHGSLDTSLFQFADRASVSLRTPKHFFRSFGVLSIAAVIPSGGGGHARLDGTNPSLINNSWFIGAFGMWWWAAYLDGFWRDIGIVGPKEDDGSSITGILDMKALDRAHDRHVLPSSHQLQSSNNGKQRSRERFNQQRHSSGNVVTNRRSSTPPPLPRSASLPLHAKRTGVLSTNPSSTEHTRSHGTHTATHTRQRQTQQAHPPMPTAGLNEQVPTTTTTASNGTPSQHASNNCPTLSYSPSSKSPAVAFAESPQISEILRKVDTAQASVNELQEQLTSATQSASANAATRQLQEELEQQRARKQTDDATRTEIRTRTRALEDSKRHAESSKREVEKRLKSAQSAAATSERRTSTLTSETTSLRAATQGHVERAERSKSEADALCNEMKEEVEGRKCEVKDVEDVLTALVRRVKELEAKVADEEERLRLACEEAEIRKQSESLEESMGASTLSDAPIWPVKSPHDMKPRVMPHTPALEHGAFDLGSLSRLNSSVEPLGYFSRSMIPKRSETVPTTAFAPFRSDQREDTPISPMSSSFIPTSLIESLGIHSSAPALYSPSSIVPRSPLSSDQHEQCLSPMSRSFQSDDDVILDRRESVSYNGFGLAPGSGAPSTFVPTPASLSPASPNRSFVDERSEGNGVIGPLDKGTYFDTSSVTQQGTAGSKRTGWFAKDRKGHSASVGGGLNPDAKEFSLPKDRTRTLSFLFSKPRSATVTAGSSDGLVNVTPPSFDSKANTPDSSGSSVSFTPSFEDSASSLSSFSSPAASIRSTASSGLPNASSNKFLGLSGVGSTWLGTTQSAFAPTPTEREALTRALAGGSTSKNASMDQLPNFLTSASTSPQPQPALPSTVNNALRSPGLISRPAWLEALRNGKAGTSKSSSFSPFDDDSSRA